MKSQQSWERLVRRLEADLKGREQFQEASLRDNEAWGAVAKLLRSRARILLLNYSGLHPEDAEDLVQNVMVKLQSPGTVRRLRAARSAEGYMIVILRNAATDLVRSRLRERKALDTLGAKLWVLQTTQPHHDRTSKEALKLRHALGTLTDEERNLVEMRFWQSLKIRDIADQTGLSYSATAVRLFRIIEKLRERLADHK